MSSSKTRRDVPVGVPLDLSTPTGMSCIWTYGENCKSDNVSKYRVLLVALLLLWHELMSRKNTVNSNLIIYFISYFPKINNSYGNSQCFEYIGSNQIQY